ncbi:MAG: hypothetical protein Q7S76_02915 [bacterium]|nr:hypothetical protein [bacterium]
MNRITLLDTNYLRPNRTIDSILLSNKKDRKLVFVYNYEGVHFRLFVSPIQVVDFFNEEEEPNLCFESEIDLDNALERLNLKN